VRSILAQREGKAKAQGGGNLLKKEGEGKREERK
jgi:hypothetical protein